MQHEIGQGSVLGFIPTNYPAGVVLVEVWKGDGIQKVTGYVHNIETDTEWINGRFFSGQDSMKRATVNLIERATEYVSCPS